MQNISSVIPARRVKEEEGGRGGGEEEEEEKGEEKKKEKKIWQHRLYHAQILVCNECFVPREH